MGENVIADLILLRRADQIGMCRENAAKFPEGLSRFAARTAAVLEGERAFTVKGLAVNGEDLMLLLGLQPGPAVGALLSELLMAVLDDPGLNKREKLLEIAKKFYKGRMNPER